MFEHQKNLGYILFFEGKEIYCWKTKYKNRNS